MCMPSAPPAPDYRAAAREQGAANVEAARLEGKINNPNVISPFGSQSVSWDGDTPTLTQTYSPVLTSAFDAGNLAKKGLSELALAGTTSARDILGTRANLQGLPTGRALQNQLDLSTLQTAPALQQPLDLSRVDDPASRYYNAMMARTNEDYLRDRENLHSNLVAMGLRPGSKGYDDRLALLDRSYTDAKQQAFVTGRRQAINEMMGERTQGLEERRQAAELLMRERTQGLEERRQAIANLLAERQAPLNEIAALMHGGQVANPFATPAYAQNAQVAPSQLYAATTDQANYARDLYNIQAQQAAGLQQGLLGLGGAGAMGLGMWKSSDRRLKSNIKRYGTHPLGIGLYEYDIEDRHERGVMADELLMVKPSAVTHGPDGYLRVYYNLIGGRPY